LRELACGGYIVPGGMSSRKVVWFRYVFSIAAFCFMIATDIALVVYDHLFTLLLFSSAEAKTADRILHISSIKFCCFLEFLLIIYKTGEQVRQVFERCHSLMNSQSVGNWR
jgi:hypothetical protein